MLGRVRDLAKLSAALDAGESVLVLGAAGVGKTALVREALRDRPYLEGAAVVSLRWKPYLPLSSAVGLDLAGDPEQVASEVTARLAGHTLLLEDVHWADPATSDVVGLLAGRVPLVVTSRTVPPELERRERLTTIRLEPLAPRSARALARRLHPELTDAALDGLVALAAGNPLLLEHLASDGHTSPSLRAAVVSRFDEVPPATREVLIELALLGRPIDVERLGVDRATLPPTLVAFDEGRVALQHQLLADVVVESLGPAERAAAHLRLAGRLPRDQAAEQLLAAGELDEAREAAQLALRDVSDPPARAHLLSIAASAGGDDRLRVEAAAALVAVGDWRAAERHATAVTSTESVLAAEAVYHLSRARWFAGDPAGARNAIEAGLGGLGPSSSDHPIAARLHVELAHQRVRVEEASRATAPIAEAALAVAERAGVDVARARNVLATALAHDGRPGWEEAFRAVIPEAAAVGDGDTESAAMFLLASHLGFAGRCREAIILLETGIDRAGRLGQLAWRTHMESAVITDRFIVGDEPERLAADALRFVTAHPYFRNRAQTELVLALSEADLDRFEEARARLRVATNELRSGEDRSILLSAAAEVAWLAGDLRLCLKLADEATADGPGWFGITTAAAAVAALTRFELGEPVDDIVEPSKAPIFAPFELELEAWRHWTDGDVTQAIACLDAVAERWARTGPARYAYRARWAAGTVAAGSADPSARHRLEAAREKASRAGSRPLVRRAVAALARLEGGAGLTPREVDVLRLVGDGLTSQRIADRLGISQTTVETHVAAATRKLGARTRRQAASLLDQMSAS